MVKGGISPFFTHSCATTPIRVITPIPVRKSNLIIPRLSSVGYLPNNIPGIYPGYYPTKNSCKFCRTFIPVPGTSVSSRRHLYPYPELLRALYARATNTQGTGKAFFFLPETSLCSVRPCRHFCEFCGTFVPLPVTFVSSVRFPYSYSDVL